ncbi:MAG: ABC transporter ATP-binding protein [Lachnospiraceae bacterium]|nr:ABC transporter ATP-binding protein [Lachnospiraceae bacterium]
MIKVSHLTKRYGPVTAVKDLSFEIGEGHVYGFLGPNGAGKSTTMNIMTGCLSPTKGHVTIDGHDIIDEPAEAKKCIGYLPELPPLYMNDMPVEYLRFVGRAKGLKGKELKEQIQKVVYETKIDSVKNRKISQLSKGYRQRVGIAQALIGNPKVVILDEPTVGLDPHQIVEIRDLIRDLGNEHTVILSSHILSEVQAVCDQILIISHGKLVAFGTPDELEEKLAGQKELVLVTRSSERAVQDILKKVDGIAKTEFTTAEGLTTAHIHTTVPDMHDVSQKIFQAFRDAGEALLELYVRKASLEDVFLRLTEEEAVAETQKSEKKQSKKDSEAEGKEEEKS